jgi:hypothetical protein
MVRLFRLITFIFLLLPAEEVLAFGTGFKGQQMTFSTGSISTSYSEKETGLDNSTGDSASGSASALPVDLSYEFTVNEKTSWFVRGIGPLLASTPDSYFFAGGGVNFYLMSLSSAAMFKDTEIELLISPKWRYYWGLNAGVGNLVYRTDTEKKNDTILEIGLHAGAIYSINKEWGFKAEGSFNRGTGSLTEVSTVKVLLGATMYL